MHFVNSYSSQKIVNMKVKTRLLFKISVKVISDTWSFCSIDIKIFLTGKNGVT